MIERGTPSGFSRGGSLRLEFRKKCRRTFSGMRPTFPPHAIAMHLLAAALSNRFHKPKDWGQIQRSQFLEHVCRYQWLPGLLHFQQPCLTHSLLHALCLLPGADAMFGLCHLKAARPAHRVRDKRPVHPPLRSSGERVAKVLATTPSAIVVDTPRRFSAWLEQQNRPRAHRRRAVHGL